MFQDLTHHPTNEFSPLFTSNKLHAILWRQYLLQWFWVENNNFILSYSSILPLQFAGRSLKKTVEPIILTCYLFGMFKLLFSLNTGYHLSVGSHRENDGSLNGKFYIEPTQIVSLLIILPPPSFTSNRSVLCPWSTSVKNYMSILKRPFIYIIYMTNKSIPSLIITPLGIPVWDFPWCWPQQHGHPFHWARL